MMPVAKIVHATSGFRCELLGKNLSLSLGLDGSAALHYPGSLPAGWLIQALDQLLIAAPQLSGIALPYAEWREELQALALFAQACGDYLARETFYQLPLWLIAERQTAGGQMQYDAERELWFPQRPARPSGEVYRRYDPQIKRSLSFRLPEVERDAEQFTRWMNSPALTPSGK